MKDKIKGLIIGLIIGMTIVSTGVLATNGAIQKSLWYNNIKITLDNKEIKPTDANGNYVEPFIIDGTTYLPVRAVSDALGLYVDWDANTNTVKLSTSKPSTSGQNSKVIHDNNGIKITYKNYEFDKYGSLNINLLIENNSNQPIRVKVDNTSLNGFMIYGSLICDVEPGKKANDNIEFYKSSLEENGIKSLESVEFVFDIVNPDTYDNISASGVIKITPQGASTTSNNTTDNGTVSNRNNGYGQVKGQFTYQYNKVLGTRGDNGAKVLLIPKDKNVKNFDNNLAVSGITGEYDSGIIVTKCDGYGNFDFGDSVPAGEYLFVVISKNTTSNSRFGDKESWEKQVSDKFDDYLSDDDVERLMLTMGYQSLIVNDITVENGKILTLTHDFGYTYI